MASSAKKPALGKGLSALMGEEYSVKENGEKKFVEAAPVAPEKVGQGGIQQVPVSGLQAGKYQPRQFFDDEYLHELADSIEKNGIMQPLVVRAIGSDKYEIIAGERRFRAAQLAGLSAVPAIVRDDISDQQALELALIENIQRRDLTAIEEAEGYQRLIKEFKYSQEELAKTVGKSRSHITNLLRLLSMPEKLKTWLNEGKLSMGHARALLKAEDAEEIAKRIIKEGLSVRQTEELARGEDSAAQEKAPQAKGQGASGSRPRSRRSSGEKDDDILALEESLSQNLGMPVSIEDFGDQSGEITLCYNSLMQLDSILQRLNSDVTF